MHARVVVGVGKGVLFREVSSVQRCPYREVPLYIDTCMYTRIVPRCRFDQQAIP